MYGRERLLGCGLSWEEKEHKGCDNWEKETGRVLTILLFHIREHKQKRFN